MAVIHRDVIVRSQQLIRDNPAVEVGGKFLGFEITPASPAPRTPYGQAAGGIWGIATTEPFLFVVATISSGPHAKQTSGMLIPDSEFQVKTFHRMAEIEPDIEHIGSWHSHHPNGLRTFSPGDVDHYRSVVVDSSYGPNLFLAGLCVDWNGLAGGRFELFSRVAPDSPRFLHDAQLRIADSIPSLQREVDKVEYVLANTSRTSMIEMSPRLEHLGNALASIAISPPTRTDEADATSWLFRLAALPDAVVVVTHATEGVEPVAISVDIASHGVRVSTDINLNGNLKAATRELTQAVRDVSRTVEKVLRETKP